MLGEPISFTSPHYKSCYRDPEYPRWNYPWDEMTEVGDFFTVSRLPGESTEIFERKVKSACSNALRRKKNQHKQFQLIPVKEGLIMVKRTA